MPEIPPLLPVATEPLSVVLLTHPDDAPHLETVLAVWMTYLNGLARPFELILVDGGSGPPRDEWEAFLAKLGEQPGAVRVLRATAEKPAGRLAREGVALRTGIAAATHPLIFYTRGQPAYSRPADLKRLFAEIDKVHLVTASRAGRRPPAWWRVVGGFGDWLRRLILSIPSPKTPPTPTWRGWGSWWAHGLCWWAFGVHSNDMTCPFRLIRREAFDHLPIQSDGHFAHAEILAKALFLFRLVSEEVPLGDRQTPFPAEPREPGATRQAFREGWRLLSHPDFGPPPPRPSPIPPIPATVAYNGQGETPPGETDAVDGGRT